MRAAGATLTSDRKSDEVTKVTEKRIIELLKDNSKYKTTELADLLMRKSEKSIGIVRWQGFLKKEKPLLSR